MKDRIHIGAAVLVVVLAAWTSPLAAQCQRPGAPGTDRTTDRPRVGLVLGGGGARGIAHVGVLRALEELRVPVDLVVGTSMGAIVGSLYASGLSPDSMYRWLESADWADLFRDRPSYSRLSFRRKEEAREFPVPLVVGLGGDGVELPTGLIAGQKLNAELRSLTFPVARIADFDSLAVPFRAVATDLETGHPVVLGDGDLVDAVRASFSVPGVFTPYSIDGRLLVDGGLVQNVPVHVACELGADVIIAVDVGARLADRSELGSVVDLTMQVTRIMTRSGTEAQVAELGPDDILIEPDLGDMGSMAFDRWDDAVAAGAAAARALAPTLSRLAVSEGEYQEDRWRRLSFGDPTTRIDFVMVGAYSRRSPGSIIDRIATRPGPLDTVTLNADIEHLYSLGIYERVDYRIVETDEGNALILRVQEKPWGPSYLRFRLAISDRLGGEGSYSVAGHLLTPQINDWGAELLTDIEIGERRAAGVEFFQPLGVRGTFFLASQARYQSVPTDVFVDDLSVARFRTHSGTLGLEAGLHVGSDFEVALSFERGSLEAVRAIGPPSLEGFSADIGMARARFYLDGFGDPLFPQKGTAVFTEFGISRDWLGATDDFRRLDAQILGALSSRRWTLFWAAMGATSFRSTLPAYNQTGLGGFLLMSGYRPGEIRGNHMLFARGMVFREFGDDRAYAGIALEAGNAWPTPEAVRLVDFRHSVAAALGFRTPLGPVYLGIGSRGAGHPILYLEVGRSL